MADIHRAVRGRCWPGCPQAWRHIRRAPSVACRTASAIHHGRAASMAAMPRGPTSSRSAGRDGATPSRRSTTGPARAETSAGRCRRATHRGARSRRRPRGRAVRGIAPRPAGRRSARCRDLGRCAAARGSSRACSRTLAAPTGPRDHRSDRPVRRKPARGDVRHARGKLRRLHQGLRARKAAVTRGQRGSAAATSASDRPPMTRIVPNGSEGLGTRARPGPSIRGTVMPSGAAPPTDSRTALPLGGTSRLTGKLAPR